MFIDRRNLSKMDQIVDSELKIVNKFKRFFDEYELDVLFDVEDVEVGIAELKELTNEYEDIHSQLSRASRDAGDDVYKDTYQEQYDKQMLEIVDWIRRAKKSIRTKKEALKDSSLQEKTAEASKQKVQIRAEEKYLRGRINSEIKALYAANSQFVEDLEKGVIVAQKLEVELSQVFVKIETCGQDSCAEFGSNFDVMSDHIKTFVANSRERIKGIKSQDQQKEKERISSSEREKTDRLRREKVVKCKIVFDNIEERFECLESKCSVDVKKLSDPDLLSRKKDMKSLDSDFNDILDRITKLSEHNPNEFEETEYYLEDVSDRKKILKKSLDLFKVNLETEISDRDLTEEKMKNASVLGIKIPKFKGYDSVLDYYTFKSEFDKLVVPHVRANLLPDYLKNNYLDGQALQLVKEIHDLDGIWKRLKESFGDVQSLLSRKLSELDKSTPLWKVKADEKLIESILRLKNLMLELKTLAESHNIQSSLFHSSNVAKAFAHLGTKRQLEITKKSLDSDLDVTEEQKWDNIVSYLDKEMKVREQVLLLKNVNDGCDSGKPPAKPPGNNKNSGYTFTPVVQKCVLCNKSEHHIQTITNKGRHVINYFACELFATSNCVDRLNMLKKKNLCFQCLSPGMKAGHKGRCFDKFECLDASHDPPRGHKRSTCLGQYIHHLN